MNIIAEVAFVVSMMGLAPTYKNVPPEVAPVSQKFMQGLACSAQDCPIRGMYPPWGGPFIYVQEDLNEQVKKSILVHELVHYYQRRARGETSTSCETHRSLEHEAYQTQASWMAENRADPRLVRMVANSARMYRCTK